MKKYFLLLLLAMISFPFFVSCTDEYMVKSGKLAITVDKKGDVVSIVYNGTVLKDQCIGQVSLDGYETKNVRVKADRENGVFVLKDLVNREGHVVSITERFFPTLNSIRWSCELKGDETPVSLPIRTVLQIPKAEEFSFWTAWGRPQIDLESVVNEKKKSELKLMPLPSNDWLDPLVSIPFSNALYYYGAPYLNNEEPEIAYCPADFEFMHKKYNGAITSIPLAMVMDSKKGNGITLALSIDEYIQDLTLEVTQNGRITFARHNHRIVDSNPITFSCDLVGHADDWREGLAWMVDRYPEYFEPANPLAKKMGGTCAYSNHDADFDVQKMKDMAFSVNWRASFDFPYMGMFLPPVKNNSEEWKRFGDGYISVDSMSSYASKMKDKGFYVLNYFNVTEFGTQVALNVSTKSTIDGEEWKNCND